MNYQKSLSALLLLAGGVLATRASAQQDLFTTQGGTTGAEFGSTVCVVGDVNLDGSADIAVGIPNYDEGGANRGRVQVYSGATGLLLWSNSGALAGDAFGSSIAFVDDVNGDGRDDVAVGAPFADPGGLSSAGQVEILSGSNGASLLTLNGTNAGDRFGHSLGFGGIFFGARRLVVGAPYKDNAGTSRGSAFLYVLPGGGLIKEWLGTQDNEHFGWSVSGGLDMTADGVPDVIVGSPDYDDGGADTGRVKTFSGDLPQATIETLPGAGPGHNYGQSVAALQNVNNDGIGDFVVGAPGFNGTTGAIYIHSGAANHPILYTKIGLSGENFGGAVASAGDPNNDTRTDVVAGGANGGTFSSGIVRVYSGLNGSVLATINGINTFSHFGSTVSGNGDFNGDNREDIVVGSPDGVSSGAQGKAIAYTGLNFSTLFTLDGSLYGDELGTAVANIGDVNSDGKADYLVGSPKDDSTTFIIITTLNENVGSVKCISGADGAILWTIYGGTEGDQLGTSIASLGDVTGDGKQDFVVGAPQSGTATSLPGYARICSGANGATLFTASGVAGLDNDAGEVVANVGDVTGDGKNDAGVGVPDYDSSRGRIFVVNSVTGVIHSYAGMFGVQAGERFGSSLSGAGDRNLDGKGDLLVGAPANDAVASNAGRVYCISGATPSPQFFTLSGPQAGDSFGSAVTTMADYDGDGKREYVIGANGADYAPFSWTDCGFVRMYLSASLIDVWNVYGGGSQKYFGSRVANIGNYGLHGFEDIIASGTEANLISPGAGIVKVIGGLLGVEKYTFDGAASADFFGSGIAGGGDINADGTIDIIVGSPFADNGSNLSVGSAKSISLKPQGVVYYGTSTPGCTGAQTLHVLQEPKIGTYYFEWGVSHVPYNLGLLLVTDTPDAGTDLFGIGVPLYVGFTGTEVYGLDINGYAHDGGWTYTPIPNSIALVGSKYYGQTVWAWTTCSLPPYNLSGSTAVEITISN